MAGRIFAVSGLSGVGKTTAVAFLGGLTGGEVVYFGNTVLRLVRERGLAETSENEQIVRIAIRKELGSACLAIAEEARIRSILDSGKDVFIDAVYTREEAEFLSSLVDCAPFFLIGIQASFALRLERLKERKTRPMQEPELRARDAVDLKKLKTDDVLGNARVHIENDGSMAEFESALSRVLTSV